MTVVTINPSASSHDAWQTGPGVMTLTDEIKLTAGTSWAGLFLPAVPVASADTINSATLYYKAYSATRDDPDIVWYAEDTDDASVFTTFASNITSRTTTTASVTDTATGIGTTNYRSVNIKSLLDEVKGRGGWVAGNDMALLGDAVTGCDIWIETYDKGSNIWYVEIDYTAAGGGGGVTLKSMYYARVREG